MQMPQSDWLRYHRKLSVSALRWFTMHNGHLTFSCFSEIRQHDLQILLENSIWEGKKNIKDRLGQDSWCTRMRTVSCKFQITIQPRRDSAEVYSVCGKMALSRNHCLSIYTETLLRRVLPIDSYYTMCELIAKPAFALNNYPVIKKIKNDSLIINYAYRCKPKAIYMPQ